MSFFTFEQCNTTNNTELFYNYSAVNVYNTDIYEQSNRTLNGIMNQVDVVENNMVNAINMNDISESEQAKNASIIERANDIAERNKFYKITFNNKQPNFTYNVLNPTTYTATNIYLYGTIHNNIIGITSDQSNIVGELVIEHINSSSSTKLYTCFLLQERDNSDKECNLTIDQLINNISNINTISATDLNLNDAIPVQRKCFHYSDSDNYRLNEVFIFTKPILISTESASLISTLSYDTTLFSISAPIAPSCINITDNNDFSNKDEQIEGMENYFECTLENADGSLDTKQIDMDSNNSMNTELYQYILQSFVSIIVVFIFGIHIPKIYKYIYDSVKIVGDNENEIHKKLSKINFAIFIICIISIGLSFGIGFVWEPVGHLVIYGILLLMAYLLSAVIIYMYTNFVKDWPEINYPPNDLTQISVLNNLKGAFKCIFEGAKSNFKTISFTMVVSIGISIIIAMFSIKNDSFGLLKRILANLPITLFAGILSAVLIKYYFSSTVNAGADAGAGAGAGGPIAVLNNIIGAVAVAR